MAFYSSCYIYSIPASPIHYTDSCFLRKKFKRIPLYEPTHINVNISLFFSFSDSWKPKSISLLSDLRISGFYFSARKGLRETLFELLPDLCVMEEGTVVLELQSRTHQMGKLESIPDHLLWSSLQVTESLMSIQHAHSTWGWMLYWLQVVKVFLFVSV